MGRIAGHNDVAVVVAEMEINMAATVVMVRRKPMGTCVSDDKVTLLLY